MRSLSEAVLPACRAVTAVVTDPPSVDLAAPTPCAEFDLRALIEHFVGTSAAMGRLGLGEELDPDDPWGGGSGAADTDWAARLRGNLDTVARGWSRPEAWDGTTVVGGSPMPTSMLGTMALIEVVLHGWDLARALDRDVVLDEGTARALDEAVASTAGLGRSMGAYAAEVSVPPGASGLDRALGGAGRDPAWSLAR